MREPRLLEGIVEADETYLLHSRKGERNLDRRPRKRGGEAARRGLSEEQVPVLIAVARGGGTSGEVLPAVNADILGDALRPLLAPDAVLVADGGLSYPPCARKLGVRHEPLSISAGVRVRDCFHIQTVSSRHSQWKHFLDLFQGVASKCLDSDLRWFILIGLPHSRPSPRRCLTAAKERPLLLRGRSLERPPGRG